MKRNGSGAATRKDVAELAGVAPSTVSLVLNGNPGVRVSPQTRQKILDAANKLSYQPSPIARAMVCGRTMTVGVVLHHIRAPFSGFSTRILEGFWGCLEQKGYRLILSSGKPEKALSGLFRDRSVDGIAVIAIPRMAKDVELMDAVNSSFPMVFLGSRPDTLSVDYIDIDNSAAAYWATRKLLEAGHRRILHITGPTDVNSAAFERQKGFEQAMREAGVSPSRELTIYGSYNSSITAEGVEKALAKKLNFTAVFAASHGMARAAADVLKSSGLRIPEDISITSMDKHYEGERSEPEITRMGHDLRDTGSTACRILMQRITEKGSIPANHILEGEIIDGTSVAPLSAIQTS